MNCDLKYKLQMSTCVQCGFKGPPNNPSQHRSLMRTDWTPKKRPKKEIKGLILKFEAIPDIVPACPSGYGFCQARNVDFAYKKKGPLSRS